MHRYPGGHDGDDDGIGGVGGGGGDRLCSLKFRKAPLG